VAVERRTRQRRCDVCGTFNCGKEAIEALLAVHAQLFASGRAKIRAGAFRVTQNWIGGSAYHLPSAAHVPPPQEVEALTHDLCIFAKRDDLSAIGQAAIAHAQFETIHPFEDGNARTGRALIHMILRRRGISKRVTAPISLVLATHATAYIELTQALRHEGDPRAAFFASAWTRAVGDALSFEYRVITLQANWRQRIRAIRSDSLVAFADLERMLASPAAETRVAPPV